MKCKVCETENKETAKVCRKCGIDLSLKPLWQPTWRWHVRVLGGIYLVLIVAYFAITAFLSRVPPPYRLREIPDEVRPWLKEK